jgi:hypothetical protein
MMTTRIHADQADVLAAMEEIGLAKKRHARKEVDDHIHGGRRIHLGTVKLPKKAGNYPLLRELIGDEHAGEVHLFEENGKLVVEIP